MSYTQNTLTDTLLIYIKFPVCLLLSIQHAKHCCFLYNMINMTALFEGLFKIIILLMGRYSLNIPTPFVECC